MNTPDREEGLISVCKSERGRGQTLRVNHP